MPGKGRSDKWWEVYEAVRRKGKSKASAAKITNSVVPPVAGASKPKRKRRARKP